MTDIELQEYNELSIELRNFYNMGMAQHTEWSHKQALTFAIVVGNAGGIGGDPPIDDDPNTILGMVLQKAKNFIEEKFPRIYLMVKTTFDNVISKVKSGLIKAWNEIMSWFT